MTLDKRVATGEGLRQRRAVGERLAEVGAVDCEQQILELREQSLGFVKESGGLFARLVALLDDGVAFKALFQRLDLLLDFAAEQQCFG
jgi:hypothetical protein